jgi:hypothetical protein
VATKVGINGKRLKWLKRPKKLKRPKRLKARSKEQGAESIEHRA